MSKLFKYFLGRFSGLFLVCPLYFMQTSQQPVDNLTILNNLASTVIQKIVDQLSPDSSASLLIYSQSQKQPGNWWLENWFVKNLYQRGVSKIQLNEQNSENDLIIEFKILTLGVQYLRTEKKNLIGRQCNLSLAVRATEGSSGLVKFSDEFIEQYADSVLIRDVSIVENKYFSFTQASLPERFGFKKFIEPLIVLSTTAGVVYLFFRLRSN